MCSGSPVPGAATVTAGCATTNLSMNCAQVCASNSAAHSGSGRSPIRCHMRLRPKGR